MVGLISQATGYNDQDSQSCRGDSQANLPSNGTPVPSGSAASSSKPHGVKLSWKASIPASNSPDPRLQRISSRAGQRVRENQRRSRSGHYLRRLSRKTGRTYYYEARAVSANGSVSKPSP